MTMTFFMFNLLLSCVRDAWMTWLSDLQGRSHPATQSGEAAISPQNLRIDPAPIRSRQERHEVRNVLGLAQSFKRCQLAELRDLLGRFAVEKQIGPSGSRSHGIHRDASASQLVRQHWNEAFDAGLRCNIGTVCGK